MPSLKQIEASIELGPSDIKLGELAPRVGDGYVEVFIVVPEIDIPFTIHVKTEGYIAPGLAFFVFIDGEYQCNRNRVHLKLPGDGVVPSDYETEFRLRQKEEKTAAGDFLVRDWRFTKLNRVKADKAPNLRSQFVSNVGSIEVVVLRCQTDEPSVPPRLIPGKARETVQTPTKPPKSHKHNPSIQETVQTPAKPPESHKHNPSVQEPVSELGGLMGLFDGAYDDINLDTARYEQPMQLVPDTLPQTPQQMEWDSVMGEFRPASQHIGHGGMDPSPVIFKQSVEPEAAVEQLDGSPAYGEVVYRDFIYNEQDFEEVKELDYLLQNHLLTEFPIRAQFMDLDKDLPYRLKECLKDVEAMRCEVQHLGPKLAYIRKELGALQCGILNDKRLRMPITNKTLAIAVYLKDLTSRRTNLERFMRFKKDEIEGLLQRDHMMEGIQNRLLQLNREEELFEHQLQKIQAGYSLPTKRPIHWRQIDLVPRYGDPARFDGINHLAFTDGAYANFMAGHFEEQQRRKTNTGFQEVGQGTLNRGQPYVHFGQDTMPAAAPYGQSQMPYHQNMPNTGYQRAGYNAYQPYTMMPQQVQGAPGLPSGMPGMPMLITPRGPYGDPRPHTMGANMPYGYPQGQDNVNRWPPQKSTKKMPGVDAWAGMKDHKPSDKGRQGVQSKQGFNNHGWANADQQQRSNKGWGQDAQANQSDRADETSQEPDGLHNPKFAEAFEEDCKNDAKSSKRSNKSGHGWSANNNKSGGWGGNDQGGWGGDNNGAGAWGDDKNQAGAWGGNNGQGDAAEKSQQNNGWDNNDNPASVRSQGWATASQSKNSAGGEWDTSKQKESRPRRDKPDVDPRAHIKPYFKDWNKPPNAIDTDEKKRSEPRNVYKVPALPRPTVPTNKAKDVSHGVQAGKGADYTHKCRRPIYIDSMEKPYAVFSFKYRSKEKLEKILGKPIDVADLEKMKAEVEHAELMNKSKDELAAEVQKMRMGRDRQSAASKSTSKNDAAGWDNMSGEGTSKKPSKHDNGWDNGAGGWDKQNSRKSSNRTEDWANAQRSKHGWIDGANNNAPSKARSGIVNDWNVPAHDNRVPGYQSHNKSKVAVGAGTGNDHHKVESWKPDNGKNATILMGDMNSGNGDFRTFKPDNEQFAAQAADWNRAESAKSYEHFPGSQGVHFRPDDPGNWKASKATGARVNPLPDDDPYF